MYNIYIYIQVYIYRERDNDIYIYIYRDIYIYIDITYIVFTHRFLTVFPEKRMLRAYHIVVSVILSGRPWGPQNPMELHGAYKKSINNNGDMGFTPW